MDAQFWICGGTISIVSHVLQAASLTLPVCEVSERADRETKSYPGVVKAIARVDIVPQVCAEVLEVGFADGAAVRKGMTIFPAPEKK